MPCASSRPYFFVRRKTNIPISTPKLQKILPWIILTVLPCLRAERTCPVCETCADLDDDSSNDPRFASRWVKRTCESSLSYRRSSSGQCGASSLVEGLPLPIYTRPQMGQTSIFLHFFTWFFYRLFLGQVQQNGWIRDKAVRRNQK